jgi:spoIIIJ-associated protein
MSQEITTLEIIAQTVDEAIERGLSQLGVERKAVEVEVLDAGSKGLFGIGSRQARVILKLIANEPAQQKISTSRKKPEQVDQPISEEDESLTIARKVVEDLLQRMRMNAKVTARYVDPSEGEDERTILVDIQGDDLSILIGKRSETLNALQYISSLIIGKELNHWTPLMIDIQGYRLRRERQLRQLARRMADQAVQTGKRQVLEPMPASERRLIHLELRDHPQIVTESVGDEPNRKVTILLKK